MKTPAINLLHERKRKMAAAVGVMARLQRISMAVLLGYGVILAGVIGYGVFIKSQINSVAAQVKREEGLITSQKQKEQDYTLTKLKLALAQGVMTEREKLQQSLGFIYALASSGVELNDVSIGDKKQEVVVAVTVTDVFVLQDFLNKAADAVSAGAFKGVMIADLRRDSEGRYKFLCTFPLNIVESAKGKKQT